MYHDGQCHDGNVWFALKHSLTFNVFGAITSFFASKKIVSKGTTLAW
jgi:hypothetical protein